MRKLARKMMVDALDDFPLYGIAWSTVPRLKPACGKPRQPPIANRLAATNRGGAGLPLPENKTKRTPLATALQ